MRVKASGVKYTYSYSDIALFHFNPRLDKNKVIGPHTFKCVSNYESKYSQIQQKRIFVTFLACRLFAPAVCSRLPCSKHGKCQCWHITHVIFGLI